MEWENRLLLDGNVEKIWEMPSRSYDTTRAKKWNTW